MNEINPDGGFPGSASDQGVCYERFVAGAVAADESSLAMSSDQVSKRPPAPVCSSNNRSLCILEELNKIYEERLADIDQQTNGNHELKYLTYKEWVEMLLKLMRDLIGVVQELEYEASTRIELLEKKLQSENGSACNMGDVAKVKSDVNNLVELIRRAIQDGTWNMDGLDFNTVKMQDIFGPKLELSDSSSVQTCALDSPRTNDVRKLNSQLLSNKHELKRLESQNHTLHTEVERKDLIIRNYANRIKELERALKHPKDRRNSLSTLQEDTLTGTEEDEVFKACISDLKACIKEKELHLAETLKENECLKTELRLFKTQAVQKDKAVANMRALAFEVADKHDQIILLRDQVNSLEEELKKAHKKVQFKENVIKELRREIKNSTKIEYSSGPCNCLSGRRGESDTENKSFKSVTFNDFDYTQRSDCTMNTVIDPEMAKLGSSVRDEEDRCIQTLKDELDGLLMFQSYHNETMEEQKRTLAAQQTRLREIVYKMFTDLSKNRNKLSYMRTRLMELACSNDASSRLSPKQIDSGYISPEDMETECHIIDTVKYRINEIKAENDHLKEQIRKSATDMSRKSSGCTKCRSSGNSEKILQEVASTLSNICGQQIPVEVDQSPAEANEGQVHPICKAMFSLENELNEKNRTICNSENMLAAKDREIRNLQQQLARLQDSINEKNFQIEELHKAVDIHLNAVDRLNSLKQQQENEIAGLKKMTERTDYKELIEAKENLEVELCTDIGHDVLSEQLLEMFQESMRWERILVTIRGDNFSLKETLADAEFDYRMLEKRYQIIEKQLNPCQLREEFRKLNERTKQLQQEIQSRGGDQLYGNCFRYVRSSMEKEYQRRLKEQEVQYTKIINELNSDLNFISTQVQATQKELSEDELANFEATLHELEAQNEALQNTIGDLETKIANLEVSLEKSEAENRQLVSQNTLTANLSQDKDAKYQHLADQYQILAKSIHAINNRCKCGANNIIQPVLPQVQRVSNFLSNNKEENAALQDDYEAIQRIAAGFQPDERIKEMQVQIDLLEKTLEKRDQELRETNARLLQYAQQNGELTSELYMAQDQLFYLQAEDDRHRNMVEHMKQQIIELQSGRREREQSLISEMAHLRQTMDHHVRALSKANDTINLLERQTQEQQRQENVTNKENVLVKAEVFRLKENLATKEGIEKSLRAQLTHLDKGLTLMKVDLEKYKTLVQDIENLKKHCGRLKEANYDLVKKYNELVEEYNNLEEEYRKLIDIKDQLFAEVENCRTWQKHQVEQDKLIASKFKKLEEHIDLLLDDRKKLITKVGELHRDTIIITGELEQYKDLCSGSLGKMDGRMSWSVDSLNDNNVEYLTRKMQRITRKMEQTRKVWEEGLQQPPDD